MQRVFPSSLVPPNFSPEKKTRQAANHGFSYFKTGCTGEAAPICCFEIGGTSETNNPGFWKSIFMHQVIEPAGI